MNENTRKQVELELKLYFHREKIDSRLMKEIIDLCDWVYQMGEARGRINEFKDLDSNNELK